ncbi:MAG: DUF423 domain-containing protein [Sedimenticola sp.]|nr:DUF423 domain-containing protein [Sedimenticola sp.]
MSHPRLLLFCCALSGFLVVALGAFGAHALAASLTPKLQATYQTAVEYQGLHTLAALAITLLSLHFPESRWLTRAGWLMLLGILLFSGSLYLLALTGIRALGMITPFGGLTLLLGWAMLAFAVLRLPGRNRSS